MGDLHISLLCTAIAALITLWRGVRCIVVRKREKIMQGDGGNGLLARRIRAQANFGEYAPVALVLIVVLDLAGRDGWVLGLGALFFAGRVLHALGMDASDNSPARMAGMALTFLPLLGGAGWVLALGLQLA